MHFTVSKIVVHDQILFGPGGDFNRWIRGVTAELHGAGTIEAPLNNRAVKSRANAAYPVGSLKAGIRANVTRVGPRQFTMLFESTAPYSKWVHEGTGRIYSRSARTSGGQFAPLSEGGGMYLPGNLGFKSRYRQSVRGQRANPFLRRAWNNVSRSHAALKPFRI